MVNFLETANIKEENQIHSFSEIPEYVRRRYQNPKELKDQTFSILSNIKFVLNHSSSFSLLRFRDAIFSGFKALPKHQFHNTT